MQLNKPKILFFGSTFLGCLLLIIKAQDSPIGDFANYYFGSKFLINQTLSFFEIYDIIDFNRAIQQDFGAIIYSNYTTVPPFSLIFYIPFCFFPILVSKFIWNLLNLVLFLQILNKFYIQKWYFFSIPFVFLPILWSNFSQGQSYILLVFLLINGYFLYEKNHKTMAIILWSIAGLLKITPFIFIIFLWLRKDYKSVFISILTTLILSLSTLFFLNFEHWRFYLSEILPRLFNGEINNPYALNYQSIAVLFKTLFVKDLLQNPQVVYHSPWISQFLILVFNTSALLLVMFENNQKKLFSTLILISIFISGYGSTYGLILLLIPFLTCISEVNLNPQKVALLLLLLLLINFISIGLLENFSFPFNYGRLFLMLAFLALLVKKNNRSFSINSILLLIIFLASQILKMKPEINIGEYVLKQEKHLLMYDFEIKNNVISVDYFTDKGKVTDQILLNTFNYKPKLLDVKKNIILVNNKSIQLGNEKIKKAILIGNKIYYLSDKNRGIGFYTLRVLNLNE